MKLRRALGIDLGTTNSAVALMNPTGTEVILARDAFGRGTIPSMVGWDPQGGEEVVGWKAWNRRILEPAPISSIKRKMGTAQRAQIGPESCPPPQVSAKILEHCVQAMRSHLERAEDEGSVGLVPLQEAVVTIPAYFDAPQIEATRQAGELAGLRVLGLLQEPTAAAMHFAWHRGIQDGNFLVYDLGGGTFDVSVIRCLMGEYQVLGIDGDNYLGGDDFDRRLAEHVRQELVAQGYALELDLAGNQDDLTRFTLLMRVAQEAKEALSAQDVYYIGKRDLFEDQRGQSVSLDLEVSRQRFEELMKDLVAQTITCCERALTKSVEAAEVGLEQIDHVLLVGGSTRSPYVQQAVAQAFCGEGLSRAQAPEMHDPETCVARGAAIHAANLSGLVILAREEGVKAQVRMKSILSTNASSLRVAGAAEGVGEMEIDSLVLLTQTGEIAGITRPKEGAQEEGFMFVFEEVELEHHGMQKFELELCDEDGDPLVGMEVPIERLWEDGMMRSTGSALSNPSVLAKDIYLGVVREGQPSRQLLVKSGTSLPTEGKFRFYTTDRSGAVILRLFQNRFPIKTIHLGAPEHVEVGTALDLNLSIDETMAMVASGEVMGQSFWAQIEPPAQRQVKGWEEIEALLDRQEEVARQLWGYEARYFGKETEKLTAGIRETAKTDPDKLQVLVGRLEEFMDQYRASDRELTPSYGLFSDTLDQIKRVVYRGDEGAKLGLGRMEWVAKVGQIEEQGMRAYEDHDQEQWSALFNQAQAIWESLAQEEYRLIRSDPAEYVERLRVRLAQRIAELEADLHDFAISENPETKQLQLARLGELRGDARTKLAKPFEAANLGGLSLLDARQEFERLDEMHDHIRRQLEKLPTLGMLRR